MHWAFETPQPKSTLRCYPGAYQAAHILRDMRLCVYLVYYVQRTCTVPGRAVLLKDWWLAGFGSDSRPSWSRHSTFMDIAVDRVIWAFAFRCCVVADIPMSSERDLSPSRVFAL